MLRFFLFGFLLVTNLKGELRLFEIGEKPLISLRAALDVLEKEGPKFTKRDFNPRSVELMGNKQPGKGSWQFIQIDKDGRIFRYVFFFPEDLCVIFDEVNGQKFIVAFSRNGKAIPKEKTQWRENTSESDPFSSVPK